MRSVLSLLALSTIATLFTVGCAAPTDNEEDEPSITQAELARGAENTAGWKDVPNLTPAEREAILARYASIAHDGVRSALWEKAVLYYDVNRERIVNKRWLTIIDFAKHSKQRRFFMLDMEGGAMTSYVVAHGKNSDPNDDGLATSFSNVEGSNQSSVGYYVTAETYVGSHGRSLRLDGLSSTNSNARERLIVVHGAAYVEDGRSKQGRSLGCPALPDAVIQGVIDKLEEGSLVYAMN